jgi:hypothetical protein
MVLRQWKTFSSGKIVTGLRQWSIKCKNVVVGLRHYTSGYSKVSRRNFFI